MKTEHHSLIASLFQGPVLADLARFGRSTTIDEVLSAANLWDWFGPGRPVQEAFEKAYGILRRAYRSEYLFKNAIAQKVLLGRHSVRSAMLIPELRVENCRADIVVLNGTSTVYEIKTGLDNLDRLGSQLSAYQQAFDRICVLTEAGLEDRIAEIVDASVGILTLTSRYTIRTIREPASNVHKVSSSTIFDLLREAEYLRILKDEIGDSPSVPNGIRYSVCKEKFLELEPERAHAAMVRELRKRAASPGLMELICSLPPSLKAAGYGLSLSRVQRLRLLTSLRNEYPLSSRYEPVH